MDLLKTLKDISGAEEFKKTPNFYYENHICEKNGNNIKVCLDYTLSNELTDDILRFGMCSECRTCFYHTDFQSRGL